MKKLLTILAMLVVVVSQVWADGTARTVWAGKQEISWATNKPEGAIQLYTNDQNSNMFSGISVGNTIRIYYSDKESNTAQYKIYYRKGDQWTETELTTTKETEIVGDKTLYYLSYTVTTETQADIAAKGLKIDGENYYLEKIVIIGYDTSSCIWQGYIAISWDASKYAGIQFDTNGELSMSGLAKDDKIKITTITEQDKTMSYELDYKKGDDWSWTKLEGGITFEDNVITYVVESEDVGNLIAQRGLVIKGEFFHVTKIEVEKGGVDTNSPVLTESNEYATGTEGLTSVEVGQKIRVKYSKTDSNQQSSIIVSYLNGSEKTSINGGNSEGSFYEIKVTSDNVESIKTNGLYITGNNVTVSGVEVKEAKNLSWYSEYEIAASEFSSIEIGGKINLSLTGTGSIQIVHKDPDGGWKYIVNNRTSDEQTTNSIDSSPFTFEVTSDNLDNIKARGLILKGDDALAFESLTIEGAGISSSLSTEEGNSAVISSESSVTVSPETDGGVKVETSSAGQGVTIDMTKNTTNTEQSNIKGTRAEVKVKAVANSKIKVTVNYTDNTREVLETTIATAGTRAMTRSGEVESTIELSLDNNKTVSTINVQNNTEASADSKQIMVITSVKIDNATVTKSSSQTSSSDYGDKLTPNSATTLPLALDNWGNAATYETSQFANAKAGDVITVEVSGITSGAQLVLQTNDLGNLETKSGVDFSLTDDHWSYTLTKSSAQIVKDNGFLVKGKLCTVTGVYLKSSGTEAKPTLSLDDFDPIGSNTTYSDKTVTTSKYESWNATRGIRLYLGNNSETAADANKELQVKFSETTQNVKVVVSYTGSASDTEASLTESGTEIKVPMTETSDVKIKRIAITSTLTSGDDGATFKLASITLVDKNTSANLPVTTSDNGNTLPFALGVTSGSNTDWGKYVTVAKEQFATIKTGDIITISLSSVGTGAQISLKDMSYGWPALEESTQYPSVETSAASYTYTVTATTAAKLKATGLVVSGHDLTITSVSLTPSATPVTQYSLTVSNPENGSVTAYPASSDGKYDTGAQVTLTAKANSGYTFSKWTDGTNDLTANEDKTLTVTMDANKSITAVFEAEGSGEVTYPITVWEGSEAVSWNESDKNQPSISAEKFANLVLNDVIKVYVTNADNATINIMANNGWQKLSETTSYQVTTDEMLTKIKSQGIALTGQNYTLTKVTIEKPEVISTLFNSEGKADLTKFEAQSGASYDKSSHKVTATGWTGVAASVSDGETVSGAELQVTFAEAVKTKINVKFSDDTEKNVIMPDAAKEAYLPFDGTKTIKEIQIQNAYNESDGEKIFTLVEVKVNSEVTPQKTSLIDKFSADDSDTAVTYSGHVMTTTEDNKYIQAWISGDNISGKRLVVSVAGDNPPIMDILVQYNGDKTPIVYKGSASAASRTLKLDDTKTIQKVQVYLPAKGTATFSEIYIDNEDNSNAEVAMFKLTTTAVNGQITVKKDGETGNTDNREFEYGTKLTLTATAAEGYQFSKWLKNGEAAGTEATLTVTMDADVTIEAVFKGSKLNNEERRTLWESSTGEALTWSDMMVQPAEVGEIVEAGEILIVTTSAVDTSEGHYPKIELRDKDGKSLASIDPLVKGENRLSVTSAMATKMAGGFKFQGESATLLKLELYKPTPITKLAEEDKKTLWENADGEVLSWNTISIDRAAEWGSVLEEDERFIISVKAKESGDNIWPTIQLQDLDGGKVASTATLLNDVKVPGDIVITLTAEMVEKLKNGFSITGDKATITKAVLYKPALPAKTVKILNDTETAITGDALVTVSAAKLANISAYDVLTVNFAINAETAKLVIKCNGEKDGWDYIKEMEFSGNETLFALPLTESAVALLKANGLGITGSGYTFKSVTIKTAGEVADDEKEEDDISNADATEATKKVFGILKDLYGKKIVSGVVANVDWNTKEAENVYGWTGKYPAMNVYDYINLHASKDVNSEGWLDYSDISSAKNWWKEGGIVGAMWHWQVKANNGTDYTCTPGTAAGETSFDASKVYVEGTSENTLAKQQLDQLCGYLKKMQDAGIPVVWRPLHEASGNVEQYSGGKAWFWWGAKGADVYKQLWQWMYNYMVKTKGLNNLIWVWTSQTKDHNWYPGDAYVDIIGRDNYGATAASLAEEYEAQKAAYPNKMITLSECGNSETTEMAKLSSIWDAGSRWSWFMTWYDGDYNDGKSTTHKHTSEAWWKDAVAKDYVVTRDQMKELLNQGSSDNPSQTGVNISLDDLNEGWSSSYNAATKTITSEGEWTARGWYIGDDRYSQKGSITVKYEAVEFGVTLKMEYTNTSGESKSVSAGAAAGETEVELDIPTDVKTIEKVYITYQPVGTLKLTAATVNDRIADNRTEKTLVESEAKIADGDIKINRGLFSNAAAKDVIRIYATGLSDASKIALELADYSGTLEGAGWVAFTESPFELKLTENMLSSIKEKGLLVRGEAFTFTKAALYTESDLGSVISDGGSDGDGGSDSGSSSQSQEKPIFNKKDGEADLSQMSAQDESTTTVTYNKRDNTITITTTEPYKAAQIWLNTPEEVTGNVLAVEIVERGVDVTITVGYTDGSESSMSSRVAASTRAMTRGSAGTTIMVPLEVGKQVQKVEVKNANAGTITLNSMVMTNQDVFTNGKANLSMLKPQSGATYDISTYTLATTKGWTGVTVTPLETETVEGEELVVRFVDDAKVKVAVKYRSDEDGPSTIMEESANVVRLALDRSKAVQEIMIQPTEAAILVFKEIAVNWERDTSGMLIEGKTLEVWSGSESLSWNEIAHQKKDISAQLQEFDQILVTVSGKAAGNDWPKVFLRDASSEMVGKEELLNEVTSFPCVVKFVLTKDMAERLKGGFSICGDGVTVTKVEIYRPFAPKKGDIHLRALDYGYGSEYDAATNTITTTQRWAARGWEIGDSRYNNKDLVIVEFEAVDFPVTLKMEYVDAYGEKQATSAGVAGGSTEVRLAIPSGIRQMDKAYIIYQNPGSLKLTNAEVITALQAGSRGISEDSRGISISSRSGYRPDGSKATAGDDAWYSLSGQRIEKPTAKGVYIHNGKTVVVH